MDIVLFEIFSLFILKRSSVNVKLDSIDKYNTVVNLFIDAKEKKIVQLNLLVTSITNDSHTFR